MIHYHTLVNQTEQNKEKTAKDVSSQSSVLFSLSLSYPILSSPIVLKIKKLYAIYPILSYPIVLKIKKPYDIYPILSSSYPSTYPFPIFFIYPSPIYSPYPLSLASAMRFSFLLPCLLSPSLVLLPFPPERILSIFKNELLIERLVGYIEFCIE